MGFLAPVENRRPRTIMRFAKAGDVPRLVDMGLRFIEESSYNGRLAKNRHALEKLMLRLIEQPDGYLAVSERLGILTGMIGCAAYVHPWSGEWIAGELFWWVEPEHRGSGVSLMGAAERWANDKDCVRFQMIAPNERLANLYEARGYMKLEEAWQKDL